MIFTEFGLNLSRNLGTQLPALVGKALGRSGQLSSFKFSDPGTLTSPNGKIQQPAGGGREGKRRRKEKKEKEKNKGCFGQQGI